MNQPQVLSHPESLGREARLAALHAEVATLRDQRRSSSTFVEWRPDIFYYLFALTAIALPFALLGNLWNRPWTLIPIAVGVVAQAYIPTLSNRLRRWAQISRPNRNLERQIESLRAEIHRLQPHREGTKST